jgi:periplasmic divalent cation tolerance protein
MLEQIYIVTTTVETLKQAKNLAKLVIESRLAACAQVDAAITSHYRWKEDLEQAMEYRIQFKLSMEAKDKLINWLRKQHPYDCPQILAWKAESCNPEYTDWIKQE